MATAIIILYIIKKIQEYSQRSSFVLNIDGKTTMFTRNQEKDLIDTCERLLVPQVEGQEEYELEQIRADGGMMVLNIKKLERKPEVIKVEPIVYIDEKKEKMEKLKKEKKKEK